MAAERVTPNRRGARSREAVLDAAERLMAAEGFDAATVARIVEEAGVPPSSIYHYFGSKEGILLAVLERGAQRFIEALPEGGMDQRPNRFGSQREHLSTLVTVVSSTLEERPDFLNLLIGLATQPPGTANGEVKRVVNRVRALALDRLRIQLGVAFRITPDGDLAHDLAQFALAAIDGAFVAYRASGESLAKTLEYLPDALVAVRRKHG